MTLADAPLELILEPLSFEFIQRALAVAAITALACAVLSCFLGLAGWSLMGDAVSHAVLPGVAIAAMSGLPLALGAGAAGLASVGLIGLVRDRARVREDAAIGVVFTTMLAIGLILVSVVPSQVDLQDIIFGNVLGAGRDQLVQCAIIAALVVAVLLACRRDLALWALDPRHATAIGLSTRRISGTLLVALAATTVMATQVVGVMLVTAMLITPAAAAGMLTRRLSRMLVLAPIIAVLATCVGVIASYWIDASTSGCIVATLGAEFAIAAVVSGIREARLARRARSDGEADGAAAPHVAALPRPAG